MKIVLIYKLAAYIARYNSEIIFYSDYSDGVDGKMSVCAHDQSVTSKNNGFCYCFVSFFVWWNVKRLFQAALELIDEQKVVFLW